MALEACTTCSGAFMKSEEQVTRNIIVRTSRKRYLPPAGIWGEREREKNKKKGPVIVRGGDRGVQYFVFLTLGLMPDWSVRAQDDKPIRRMVYGFAVGTVDISRRKRWLEKKEALLRCNSIFRTARTEVNL